MKRVFAFLKDEEGATAVEYAIMLAAIAAVIVVAAQLLGTNTNATFTSVAADVVPL